MSEARALRQLSVPRCYFLLNLIPSRVQLHGSSDDLEQAFDSTPDAGELLETLSWAPKSCRLAISGSIGRQTAQQYIMVGRTPFLLLPGLAR